MINLTTKLGNLILVNPEHIETIAVCEYNQPCDIESCAEFDIKKDGLLCEIRMVSGTKIVVQECKRDILNIIQHSRLGA